MRDNAFIATDHAQYFLENVLCMRRGGVPADHDPPMTGCRSPIKKVVRGAYDSTLLLRWIDAI